MVEDAEVEPGSVRTKLATLTPRALGLAAPILLALIAQNLSSLVDLAFVGRLGKVATAAVGLGGYVTSCAIAVLVGLSTAVQGLSGRASGSGDTKAMAEVLLAGLVLGVGGGALLAIGFSIGGGALFGLLTGDGAVASAAAAYFLIRAIAMPAIGVNIAFRGYWNGRGEPIVFLLVTLGMCGSIILLDWLLIFGRFGLPAFGLNGAAMSSALATTMAATMFTVAAWLRRDRAATVRLPKWSTIGQVAALAVPAGLQQLFVVLSAPVILYIVGRAGVTALASGTILLNLSLALTLLGLAFGFASATLSAEALGAGDPHEAKRRGVATAGLAAIVTGAIASPVAVAPEWILSLFTTDQSVIDQAAGPLRFVAFSLPIDAAGIVFLQSLLALGRGRLVLPLTVVLQWGFALPAAFLLTNHGLGLWGAWAPQIIARVLQASVVFWIWKGSSLGVTSSARHD